MGERRIEILREGEENSTGNNKYLSVPSNFTANKYLGAIADNTEILGANSKLKNNPNPNPNPNTYPYPYPYPNTYPYQYYNGDINSNPSRYKHVKTDLSPTIKSSGESGESNKVTVLPKIGKPSGGNQIRFSNKHQMRNLNSSISYEVCTCKFQFLRNVMKYFIVESCW